MRLRTVYFTLVLCTAAGLSLGQPVISQPEMEYRSTLQFVQTAQVHLAKQKSALNAAMALRATLPATAPLETVTPAGGQKAALELAARNAMSNQPFATVGQLDILIQQLRASIENINNSLQVSMLRLQSLGNKGNEVVENQANAAEKKKAIVNRDTSGMR